MLPRVLCSLAALALAVSAQAQTYTLKIKSYPDEGKVIETKEVDKITSSTTATDEAGKVLQDRKEGMTKEIAATMKVLKAGDPKPAKYVREFSRAVVITGEKEQKLPYSGRTINYEKKDDKYALTAEGDPKLGDRELAELIAKANQTADDVEKVLLPEKAVAEGDTWQVDPKKVVKALGDGGEPIMDKVKATGKLTKVYKKGDQQWGVIEVPIEIPFKSLKQAPNVKVNEALLKLTMTLDVPIDGSSTEGSLKASGQMTIKGEIDAGGMKVSINNVTEMNHEKIVTAKK